MIIRLCTFFRTKIYTIVKLKWEHKDVSPYEYGCTLNTTYVYHKSNLHCNWYNEHGKPRHAKN